MLIITDLALYERYHRITAAEGESSDFHEGQEQFKILIHNITPTEKLYQMKQYPSISENANNILDISREICYNRHKSERRC